MTEAKFNQIIDKAVSFYTPVVAAKGGKLTVNRLWNDATVNASAERKGQDWILNMYGGLARHAAITEDGFLLIVCHELGHHLGGAPKYAGQWAANEGEADYFANLKCLKQVLPNDDNIAIIKTMTVDQVVVAECEKSYSAEKDKALCVRASMAGQSSANLSSEIGGTARPTFGTPDPSQVAQTNDAHPAAQCRLDTYFAGSVCDVAASVNLSETDPTVGSCSEEKGHKRGIRPRCWYKPGGGGGGNIANNPTVRGQTSAEETNPNNGIPVDYDVSNFAGAAGAFLEFSGKNMPFAEPNGIMPDPNRTFRVNQAGVKGTVLVTPMKHLPGWGVYGFRVIPLDSSGAKPVGKFSNASTLNLHR